MLAIALACAVGPRSASAAPPVRATFIGDSVPASIDYSASARTTLRRGLRVRLDLRVCRRLIDPSCPYGGVTPSTALEAVRAAGRGIGDVLVMDVGYNDDATHYREGMRLIERAARAQGATAIVWVTLHEARSTYRWTNIAIRTQAKITPDITVADWNAYSAGRDWFSGDGLHLNPSGADALARFLRSYVLRAAAGG